MLFSLSWTLNGIGGTCDNPLWGDVEEKLTLLSNGSGTLTLDIHDNSTGSQMLQIRAEAGDYLVMMGEIVNDDYEVRTYFDNNNSKEEVLILDDYWPKNQVTTDSLFIKQVVKVFFHTGNVKKNLLS